MNANFYRLSGDEFVILDINKNEEEVRKFALNLIKTNANKDIIIDDQSISLSITIGLSFEENSKLLSTANMALISARKELQSFMIYSDSLSLNNEYENNIKWIREIKEAIAEDRITMFYQPIVDHKNPSKKKYETLIRLIDRSGEVITPYYFLEIAKKAKLYKQLTKIVIKKSFEAFKDNEYEFSINITIEDILDPEINQYIISTLHEYNISNRVIFEIVESESIEDFDEIEKFIIMIKQFGCRISIDDFGTGYSNFEHLMRLQADFIKIDGSIIKEITTNKRSELITSVIVAFAKELNIETIGEYVETKEINDKLINLGVNKSQGYYFDRPQAEL
jgi:EAL domain-containing protein (putative c-di-GMP-specific phosphodiesterase class I)